MVDDPVVVIQPSSHPMVVTTRMCVDKLLRIRKVQQMLFFHQLLEILAWKVHILMVSPSHMVLQDHENTFGHLYQH